MNCKKCIARCRNAGKFQVCVNCTAYKEVSKPTNFDNIKNMRVDQMAVLLQGIATNANFMKPECHTKAYWKQWLESEV